MSLEDILPIPPVSRRSDYDSLQNLLLARRSTRQFTDEEIDPVTIEKILDAAATAPVGFPPSDVGVLVLSTREAVRNASRALLKGIASWKTLFSPVPLALMSPFIGKENTVMFREFIVPAVEMMTRKASQGEDWFLYDAPLAIYFYGTPYNDPADPIIPATYAMLAGEALGLGTCMLGFPGYAFQYGPKARVKYGLPKKMQPGLMVIFGHPRYKNRRALKRRFARVDMRLE
jgi:nitroreductase